MPPGYQPTLAGLPITAKLSRWGKGAVPIDGDHIAELEDRLHAVRRDLQRAYDRRDALAVEIDKLCRACSLSARPGLFAALHAAERDLIAAEVAMRDAASVLTEATRAPSTTDPGSHR